MNSRLRVWGRWAFLPMEWVGGRVALSGSEHRAFEGFTLVDASASAAPGDRLNLLQDALALVGEVDPARLHRLRRYMPRVGITTAGRAEYVAVARTGFVPASLADAGSRATLAATLVGLGARARASGRAGGWRADAAAKERLLRIDASEQLRFVSRLPGERFRGLDAYRGHLRGLLAR